ncbi:MAG: AAA family ATPase [Rhodoferax sp.]|nr:AAA family ATPase [Rhodoferax sp.]
MKTTPPPHLTSRIHSVTIEGFRSLKSIRNLELPQLTVLIGANGSGKSTLIGFFEMLSWMIKAKSLQEFVFRHGGGDDQFFMGAHVTPIIRAEICLETTAGQNDYRFELVHSPTGNLVMVMNEAYRYSAHAFPSKRHWNEIGLAGKESSLLVQKNQTAKTIVNRLQQCSTYQFHDTSPNAAIHNRRDVTDSYRLRSDGGNLAAMLLKLRNSDGERYELIVKQIARVLPTFKDFVLEEEAGKVLLRWVGRQSDKVFGSHLASDGSLRLFCLLTLLNLPPEWLPDVMFFDEPELGLHPQAIAMVVELFKQISEKRQIFIATQSPYLVDCFGQENIILARANNGETVLRKLSREDYQRWIKEEYQLSDNRLQQTTAMATNKPAAPLSTKRSFFSRFFGKDV